jgi:hypothetical protein
MIKVNKEVNMVKEFGKYSHIVHGIYRGYNDVVSEVIAEVLKEMREDERDYIVNNCWVISIEKGASWPLEYLREKKWLVVLVDNMPADHIQSIIVEEFAHIYLQHLLKLKEETPPIK